MQVDDVTTPTPTLDALLDVLREADRLNVRAASMLSAFSRRIEHEASLPVDMVVRLGARRAGWDARDLTAAAEALRTMPRTAEALERDDVSWSQLRAIVRAARDVRTEDRPTLDERIAARARELLDADPELLITEIEDLSARLRPDLATRREDRAIETSFLTLQQRLGGGGRLYGEMDTERFAVVAEGIHAAAPPPTGTGNDRTLRGRQLADGLVGLCDAYLSGGGGGSLPRTPRVLAVMDLEELDRLGAAEAARVLWRVAGKPGRLTPLSAEVLACSAEVVPVIFEGAHPVAVGDANDPVTEPMRRALLARDQGCRFPCCDMPARFCDPHHIVPRGRGGPTCVTNLVLLCRRCHRRMHRSRWRITFEPEGTIVFAYRRWRHESPPPVRVAQRE